MLRDCSERGRTVEGVLDQYNRFVKRAYDEYIKPTMRYANIIVPFGSDNTTAIDFIVTNLRSKLQEVTSSQESEPYSRSLGFEIVDYAIDYIGFKNKVTYIPSGQKENYKIETMVKHLINYQSEHIAE